MNVVTGAEFWSVISAVFAGLSVVPVAYLFGRRTGRAETRRLLSDERERARFHEIYAPIVGILLDCHVIRTYGIDAPHLKQRLKNAWIKLCELHPIDALSALSDKQVSAPSGSVEYGGDFPLSGIQKQLRGREQFADPSLIYLVQLADRAQYEEQPNSGELTEADLNLLDHVYGQYDLLAKRFTGA